MKRSLRYGQCLILLATLSAMGCLPIRTTLVPGIKGRVVDSGGQPVPDAMVTVVPVDSRRQSLAFAVTVKADGRFDHRVKAPWGMWFMGDRWTPAFAVVVAHDGQQTRSGPFGGGVAQLRAFGLGKVRSVDLGDIVIADPPGMKLPENEK